LLDPARLVFIDGPRPPPTWPGAAAGAAAVSRPGVRLIYLRPYSPDLNPIEHAFAKLKAMLRKAAERAIPALSDRIGSLIDAFSPDECRDYFQTPATAMRKPKWNAL
jgi:transposase